MASEIDDLVAAQLSFSAYGNAAPPGWTALTTQSAGSDSFTVYTNGSNQIVFSFKGTDSLSEFTNDIANQGGEDWESIKPLFEEELATIRTTYPGYQIFTDGHSLGGGMAQTAALENNLSGYGQNSLPISPDALADPEISKLGGLTAALEGWVSSGNTFRESTVSDDITTLYYHGKFDLYTNSIAKVNTTNTILPNDYAAAEVVVSLSLSEAFLLSVTTLLGLEYLAHRDANVIKGLESINSDSGDTPAITADDTADSAAEAAALYTVVQGDTVSTGPDGSAIVTGGDDIQEAVDLQSSTSDSDTYAVSVDGQNNENIVVTTDADGSIMINTEIQRGATVEFSSNTDESGVTQIVTFTDSNETLQIDDLEDFYFYASISNFAAGDTIDLVGIVATGAAFDTADELTLDSADGAVTLSLDPTEDYSGESFLMTPDGSGGTDVDAVSNTQTIAFTGSDETLLVAEPASLTGIVSNFIPGDTIDLAGLILTSASITSAGVLLVQESTGATLSLQLDTSQSYAGETVFLLGDDNNGTDIVAEPASHESDPESVELSAIIDTPSSDGGAPTQATYTADVSISATDVQFTPLRLDDIHDMATQTVPVEVDYTGGTPDPNAQSDGGIDVTASDPTSYYYASSLSGIGPDNTSGTITVGLGGFYESGDFPEVIPVTLSYDPDDADGYLDPNSMSATVDLDLDLKIYAPAVASYVPAGQSADDSSGLYEFPILHVGQTGTIDVAVTNTATGLLTDSLITSANTIGAFSTENGVDLASGQSGTVTLSVTSDAAGYVSATQSLFNAMTHDADLPDQTALGSFFAQAFFYNYAEPTLVDGELETDPATLTESVTPPAGQTGGTLTQTGSNTYTLDFGTISVYDAAADDGNILIENAASSELYSDFLSGTYSESGSGFNVVFGGGSIDEASGGDYTELDDFSPDFTSFGSNTLTVVYDPTSVDSSGTTSLAPITLTVTDDVVPCFAIGTRIVTQRGEIAVEALAIGDLIRTQGADLRPITWIGHRRIDCRHHPRPRDVWPVRIAPGAFGPGMPHRELFLSPDHAVFAEGALIPIKHLVNGSSIAQMPVDEVIYYHVELPEHDVLLAEGLPCESYLDAGNRTAFMNGGAFVEAHPDFSPRHWTQTCLPMIFDGPVMERVRESLFARANLLGHIVTGESRVHLIADGRRIEPVLIGTARILFVVPKKCGDISLRSRCFVPAHTRPPSTDGRSLGICVEGLLIDDRPVSLDEDGPLDKGWHAFEQGAGYPDQRWTNGVTPLPSGARRILIDLAGPGYYWQEVEDTAIALAG